MLVRFPLFIVATGCPSERRPQNAMSCYGRGIDTAGNHVTQQQKELPTFEEISPFQVRKSSIIPLIRDRLEFGLKQRRRKDSGDLLDVLDFLNNT